MARRTGRRRGAVVRWMVPAALGVLLGTAASVLSPVAPAVSLPPDLPVPGRSAPATVATAPDAEPSQPSQPSTGAPAPDEPDQDEPTADAPAPASDCPRPAAGVVSHGSGPGRTVALTFDDGPDAQTGAVLDVLAREGVPATFFVVGQRVSARPDLVRRAVEEGHLVGNHTWDHTYPRDVEGGWTRPYLDDALGRTSAAVTAASGEPVCWFRPPGGFLPSAVLPAARGLGMTTTLWSVDSLDWKVQAQRARSDADRAAQVDEVVANATAADGQRHPVVLLHDGGGRRDVTVEALPRIVDWYRDHGYEFVRLDAS